MIPPQFDYVRPATVDEAVRTLSDVDDAKVLAGGQSFLPVLRLRLGAPTVVVDLGRTAGVRGIREDGDSLVIGAMTTHYQVLTAPLVRRHCPLLAEATSTVADPAVRHRPEPRPRRSERPPCLPATSRISRATMRRLAPTCCTSIPMRSFST